MGKDGDEWHETPAFGITVSRNSSQVYKLPLEAGETEVLSELLKKYILNYFVTNDSYTTQPPKEEARKSEKAAELEDLDVPF